MLTKLFKLCFDLQRLRFCGSGKGFLVARLRPEGLNIKVDYILRVLLNVFAAWLYFISH